ncbi:MAG: glycosyltransferase family 4 protein [Thermomicrobiales bacterium]|nr:glycosyltransferase family 4 protein [Thermomicrobiales bacterium]
MRFLLVHNHYQQRGGEEAVFEAEQSLLERQTLSVQSMAFDNDDIGSTLPAAISTVWSRSSRSAIVDSVNQFAPDIVHVHNFFPTASPSIYSAARSQGAAVVQTLHNYRLLCPNALFFRNGHVCEDCLGKFVPWPGVAHACYRDSRAASGVTAAMLTVHRARRTWLKEVDVFIALTEFSRQKFIEGGLPADRIMVKPNFIDRPDPPIRRDEDYFLFVGRLVDYKGASLLPAAWQLLDNPPPLRIAGDGPAREAVTESVVRSPESVFSSSHLPVSPSPRLPVSFLGSIPAEQVQQQMSGALALVVPSLLYENFPMTIVEAFATGLPVIASRLGAMAEIVDDGRTGLLFEPGNAADLAAKVRWATDHPAEMRQMGANARAEYEAKYTAEINYRQLMAIYEMAIERRRRGE